MAALIEGRAALIVIDMQQSYSQPFEQAGIPLMAGFAEQVDRVVDVVDACRAAGVTADSSVASRVSRNMACVSRRAV